MEEEPLRLLADCMLGRLARWLRLMGYDTAYENAATDPELARRARAEDRVLLTRDRELAGRRGLRTVLIQSQVLEDQLREVCATLPRRPYPLAPRCAVCNSSLEPLTRDQVAQRVPPYVLHTEDRFHRCLGCGRIYWPGTHFEAIRDLISSLRRTGADSE